MTGRRKRHRLKVVCFFQIPPGGNTLAFHEDFTSIRLSHYGCCDEDLFYSS